MNVQAGTRALSASDWVRLKRLQGARYFQTQDLTRSTVCVQPETGRRVYAEFGVSKIRRPASAWTDYKASQTGDYVLESQNTETKSRSLTAHTLCESGNVCRESSAISHNWICRPK